MLVENQFGHRIKSLKSDRGIEYNSKEFEKLCETEGIDHQLTVAYSPKKNGVSERKNRTMMEMARCMLFEKNLSKEFQGEVVNTVVFLLNRVPTKAIKYQTLYEAKSGIKPSASFLRVFDCTCYIHVPYKKRSKPEEKVEKGIFV